MICTVSLSLLTSCENLNEQNKINLAKDKGFIYLSNNKFFLNDTTFFPKLMNYSISPRLINDKLLLSASIEYDQPTSFDSQSNKESIERIRTHFRVIKKMGFNSIRLIGLGKVIFDVKSPYSLFINAFAETKRVKLVLNNKNTRSLMNSLIEIIDIANEEDIKVMVLLPKPRRNKAYTKLKNEFIQIILKSLSNKNNVFAYDYFNEPLYFDNSEEKDWDKVKRDKLEAYELVKTWKNQMREYAPYQLFTISFAEPIEVFEWDPAILPIDFVSIHTYHPLRVPNEIFWFSNYIDKPWIISETSLPADNDSISYKDQSIFMKEMLQRVINCGGQGIGWWQYQDVRWGPFEHNYTPLISIGDRTNLDSSTYIEGKFKDAAFLLPKLSMVKNGNCDCHTNYYNMMGYHNYKIKGTILDQDNKPIEGAVIRGWNKSWKIGMNTFTDEYGDFNLYSNDENVRFEISAPGYTKVKFTKELEYKPKPESLNLEKVGLEYHKNHFQWYMDTSFIGKSVFEFDENLFSNFKTSSSLGIIKLEKLSL